MTEFNLSDNYKSDEWILSLFESWFDPCPLNENPKFDGLEIEWKDQTFVNPPYSTPLKWVEKAIEERSKGKRVVMLLRVDTSTKYFLKIVEAGARIMFINGRLKHQTGKAANFPSMLVFFDKLAGEDLK